jgi:very-short-patch-repair endonuclease
MELERLFLALCETHGIAAPAVNAIVGPFEVDALWAGHRLIVECDGWDTHATRAAFERDRARDAWLTAEGYRVVRLTWRRVVDEPDDVAGLLRALLAQAPAAAT